MSEEKRTPIEISCSGKSEVRELLHGFMEDKHWWEASGREPHYGEWPDYIYMRIYLTPRVCAHMSAKEPFTAVTLIFNTSSKLDGFDDVSLMAILMTQFKTKRPKMRCIEREEPAESTEPEMPRAPLLHDPLEDLKRHWRELEDPLKKTRIPPYTIGDPDPSYLHEFTCRNHTDVSTTGGLSPILARLHNDFSLKQIYKDEYDIDEDLPKSGDMYSHYDSEVGGSFHGC